MLPEQFRGPDLSLPEEPGYFLVDGALRLLGVRTAGEGVVAARPFWPVANRPELGGEPPLPDHARRKLGRAGQVVRRTRQRFPQDNDLRGTTAQANGERVGEVALRVQMTLGLGQLLGHAESGAAREDRDLGHGIGVRGQDGDERVAGFVRSDGVLLLGQQRVRGIAPADEQ